MSENISTTNGTSSGSMEIFPQSSIETFIKRINNSDLNKNDSNELSPDNVQSIEEFIKEIEEEVDLTKLTQKLYAAKQDKIKIKEVKLESEIDFIKSINQLKDVYKSELEAAIENIKTKYSEEMINLQAMRQKEMFGKALINLINKLSSAGYCLVMKDNVIWAYKYYSKPYEVVMAVKQSNAFNNNNPDNEDNDEYEENTNDDCILQFEAPVCKIKSVYVNLLHPKITLGTIMLNVEGRHPNALSSGLTSVCNGTLEDREIPLNDPAKLITLLDEICHAYEIMNLSSAYYQPTGNYKEIGATVESSWSST